MAKVHIRREPLTYERHLPVSYYRDFVLRNHDEAAMARLERHAAEMDVLSRDGNERAARGLTLAGVETRVTPSRVQGQGGYFTPPAWLNDMFATAPRPGRVLADLAPAFPLPPGVQTVNLPRLTTGTTAQAGADNEAVPDTDIVDASTTSRVVTIEGMADVSLQDLEQSPPGAHMDWAIFKDLTESYDANLETQMISGSGTGSGSDAQVQGITGLTGINAVTFTNGSPTLALLYPLIGQAAAQIGNKRKLPPEAWLMTTSRWAWIGSALDSSNRPVVTPDVHPPIHDGDGYVEAVSTDLGWAVYCDDAVPTNLGAGANQDEIIACRPSDLMLFEGVDRTVVDLDVLSGTLGARIQLHKYVAFIGGRYPSGVSVISGTGMVVQTGF